MPSYSLPPIVYLPSSGGYTSSRMVPETPDRQRFPFRRYSIDDDGNLVCKTRNVSRDSRLKPYDKPPSRSKPAPLPSRRSPSPQETEDGSSDPNAAARLFASLVPTIMQNPKALDSVSSICAAHNVDSTVTASIIRAVKKQLEPPEDEALNESAQPAVQTPVPASSSGPSDAHTSAPPQDEILPFKQKRPFASGSSGHTIWYASQSMEDIPSPSDDLNPNIGDLYVHKNRATDHHDVWLFEFDRTWKSVTDAAKVYHPIIPDRVLSIRVNGTPSWITSASYSTIKGRKGKSKSWD
ncbi:hypothetical protein BJ322DRAFT_1109160 [Thelephora terrestris]|uniref:Uncharacterized protein n=1 Tax=Thelephora terrestris TaxID=56493 RepID=A0A9P6L672_9AGAM|nr:hypothetical protein BJ322DRAFT_1109160 [Thelephora terrestris]